MPRVEDIFAELGKAKFYTTLDLRSGYHHITLDKDSIKKTSSVSPFGKYGYLEVPFGLAQAPAYFQNFMNKVLNGLDFTLPYLDDVIIFRETVEQHLKHIQIVLTRLKHANLKLKKSKLLFFKKELHYLGHILTTDCIKQSSTSLSIAAKMLEKMRVNEKRYYQNKRSIHTFKVGDLILLNKHNVDKMELKWEPNYRIVKLPSAWSDVVDNQLCGKSKG